MTQNGKLAGLIREIPWTISYKSYVFLPLLNELRHQNIFINHDILIYIGIYEYLFALNK